MNKNLTINIENKKEEKTENQFMQISVRDNKLKAIINVYNPENNDTYQTVYRNEDPVHEEFVCIMQGLMFHVEQLIGAKIPNLVIEGYYRQPSGDAELLTIYAAIRSERVCRLNFAVRVHLGAEDYPYMDRLLDDLACCEAEALKYIHEGKRFGCEMFIQFAA